MSVLPADRVGPWVRALRAAVLAAAPNDDFVDLQAATAHLDALDPALSGEILAPAAVDERSGMPALAWMTRALAEQTLAPPQEAISDAVRRLDPDLASRLTHRNRLSRHLSQHTLLPTLAVHARVRRAGARSEGFVLFDHIDGEGCWVRTRVELEGSPHQRNLGLMRITDQDRADVPDGVHDIFSRHVRTALPSLFATLQDVSGDAVIRVSRARIGPFHFPGGPWPADAPATVRRTMVLHAVHEVIGAAVPRTVIADPIDTSPVSAPSVHGQRRRRLAVFRTGVHAVRAWLGEDVSVQPFG